jgi:microcystin-dependent protein
MANTLDMWSVTAALNNDASPDGAPENWTGKEINNWGRETMAVVRQWYDDPEWLSITEDLPTRNPKSVTKVSASSFRIDDCDATGYFTAGRRVRMRQGLNPPYVESHVESSSYADPNTTVTIIGSNVPDDFQDDGADVYFAKSLNPGAFTPQPAVADVKLTAGLPSAAATGGWLECDGAEYLLTTYPALGAALGSTGFADGYYDDHPDGDPAGGYFRVPDLRGRVPVGFWDGGDGDGDYDYTGDTSKTWLGEKTHVLTLAESPSHDHDFVTDGDHVHTLQLDDDTGPSGAYLRMGNSLDELNASAVVAAGNHTHSFVANGGDTAHENRQLSVVMGFVIYSGVE